jgi:hypothetical protein
MFSGLGTLRYRTDLGGEETPTRSRRPHSLGASREPTRESAALRTVSKTGMSLSFLARCTS